MLIKSDYKKYVHLLQETSKMTISSLNVNKHQKVINLKQVKGIHLCNLM